MRAGWVVAYGSFVAMGGPSVLPRALLGPRLPKGALHPRIAGFMLVLPDQHDQGTYMRYGGAHTCPPGALLPCKGVRTRALLHIGRGPLCAYY